MLNTVPVLVFDFKGDVWLLMPAYYQRGALWLVDLLKHDRPLPIPGYEIIPVPVFTEWWSE